MASSAVPRPFKPAGFTLTELMITLVIAAILIAVAIPSYNSQIRKSRRTEAKTALLDLAGREERLYSTTNTYSGTPSDLGYGAAGAVFPMNVGSGYYSVAVSNVAATTFTFTATPVAGKGQDKDTQCTSFIVDQAGRQTSAPSATCWR